MPESTTDIMLICQSCGMPLAAIEHFGTNSDNTPSQEYCCFCFEKGHFTDNKNLAGKVADVAACHDESEKEDGRIVTRNEISIRLHLLYPTLKRWKNHDNCHISYYESVNRVLEYVNDNLSRKITLKKLAEVSCVSDFHFHRIFRALMGEAPGEYVKRLRLEKAAFMLSNREETLPEIAFVCGYETQQAFSRAFRSYFGISPAAYRRSPVEVRFGIDESVNLGIEPEIRTKESFDICGIRAENPMKNQYAYTDAWKKMNRITHTSPPRDYEYLFLYDNCSTITKPEHYSIYTCVAPAVKSRSVVRFRIDGGTFAIFIHRGSYKDIGKLYCHIYRWWIPYSGYRLRETRYFEKLISSASDTTRHGEMITEIWIPVEKQNV